jgi:hypothetical protein
LGEGVEDETSQSRGEHRVPPVHPAHRVDQFPPGDRLGDIPTGSAADDRDHVFGRVGYRQREEHHVGLFGTDPTQHLGSASLGHMDVEKHNVGPEMRDAGDRLLHRTALADHYDRRQVRIAGTGPVQFGLDPGSEQCVIVHQEHPDARLHGYVSSPPFRRAMAS